MSRIGKKIINIPSAVSITSSANLVIIKGPKGELKYQFPSTIIIEISANTLTVAVKNPQEKKQASLWGTARQIIANMIEGVVNGFEKQLEISGVGYKWEAKGRDLNLNVGLSHPVTFSLPSGIEAKFDKNTLIISGIDKQLVGETAAQIRKIKKPEPYKGKGIKYVDEVIRRKAGKQVKSAK
ncbi:MAG TPA: 50S ribosomal protein L6 [bacterium]|nr:50S ribosomal protein L6 [bacterium]HPL95893.1 50S ribosomal protein L6 [bacterium]